MTLWLPIIKQIIKQRPGQTRGAACFARITGEIWPQAAFAARWLAK
jgi:hypothetical protein